MKVDSKVLAQKVVTKYLSELGELQRKAKLESKDLKKLRRLRELAVLMKTIE